MLKFDFSAFERGAKQVDLAANQMPFAVSRALNQSAFATRKDLVDFRPSHVDMHNKRFARTSLRVEPSSKTNLQVTITGTGTGGRSFLGALADGGTRTASGGNLAAPVGGQRRGAHGVVPSQWPRALKRAFKKGDAIFKVVERGKRKRLKLEPARHLLAPRQKLQGSRARTHETVRNRELPHSGRLLP